uniref:DnaJ protein ERDJ3B n=1 Tax=Tanacetum cinerariifolium TaxID=118510 RepID=A0A699GS21_TANCI|nr:DnaJ protein ERDJ3B [Tanacetum cinerariifolium]
MASMNTRLNIEKLDENIVQKHGGSKQVGFKQLGPGVETGVHGVHDEKRVWFEVELYGAQGDREAEVFQVSNDDTAVAQRWCSSCKTFGHVLNDCHKKIVSDVLKILMNPRQVVRGVQLDLKLGSKPIKQVYQPVSKRNGASASGKKSKLNWLDKMSAQCPNVKYDREGNFITVDIEKGMQDGHH